MIKRQVKHIISSIELSNNFKFSFHVVNTRNFINMIVKSGSTISLRLSWRILYVKWLMNFIRWSWFSTLLIFWMLLLADTHFFSVCNQFSNAVSSTHCILYNGSWTCCFLINWLSFHATPIFMISFVNKLLFDELSYNVKATIWISLFIQIELSCLHFYC